MHGQNPSGMCVTGRSGLGLGLGLGIELGVRVKVRDSVGVRVRIRVSRSWSFPGSNHIQFLERYGPHPVYRALWTCSTCSRHSVHVGHMVNHIQFIERYGPHPVYRSLWLGLGLEISCECAVVHNVLRCGSGGGGQVLGLRLRPILAVDEETHPGLRPVALSSISYAQLLTHAVHYQKRNYR